ncbi:nucleotidyltransferase domain-containing protein [Paenibacillus sacheonensis]|uniref:Renal dipeptidase n=1 Tax=Paenibacillus sacheonensis TaxID=742054 RepID=A0A7X4YP07_9BACL|nr:nucleotidyltransferase family protein [Paenibacillus sacheonensis]MBM7567333.1 hypothetical protein [Paenibacillus sacheonensis]NBC69883.1 Renal dipeptidase [Paenibacillus sacheonensis]
MIQTSILKVPPFSSELNLLLSFNRIEYNAAARQALQELTDVPGLNWTEFVHLVKHHRAYPTVYANISKLQLSTIPAEVVQALRSEYNDNTFQMLLFTAEMVEVSKCFEENHIRSLVLKGPVVAQRLYGDINRRTCKDLDILVPYQQIEQAEKLLLARGYVPDDDEDQILNDREWTIHHLAYTHPITRIQVELHWRLNSDRRTEPSFDELWERRNTSDINNSPVAFLGDEDLFLFLILHGARHGWFRIRWLIDIDRLLQIELNWNHAHQLLKKHGALQIAGQAIILANQLLGTPITDELIPLAQGNRPRKLAEKATVFIRECITLSPVPRELDLYYRRYLFQLCTMNQKMLFIISLLYPNKRDVETLPLPKRLYALYFPLRPILWFWRRVKQQAASS